AQMLARVRQADTVARLGGDEFVVVLEKIGDDMARSIGERIAARIREPQVLAQGTASVGASVGIAFYPRHGRSLDALLKAADSAMYRAKSAGKGAIVVCD
ncbi:MAG: GGDEF domain-containing protein, partial [Pseudomonadota bacterium]